MQNFISCIRTYSLGPGKLAEKSGIPFDRMHAIIEGEVQPSMSDIRKVAKALKVTPDYLLAESKEFEEITVLFRQAINTNEKYKADKLSYTINNSLLLLDKSAYVDNQPFHVFPKVNNDYAGAKNIAQIFRETFFNGDFESPILELPYIIPQKLNCILLVVELGEKRDGASAIINNIPFIIISPRFEPRMLFTLAHELGHIIAHHDKQNYVIVDKETQHNKSNTFNEEAFAHAFASELLMPQEGIGTTLKTIRSVLNISGDFFGEIELLYLSRIYGVSFESAAVRCENLGLIPVGTAASLYESITREYGNPEKRARQLELPPRLEIKFPKVSSNLLAPAIAKIQSGEISLEKASELLSLSVLEILNYNAAN